MQQRELPATGRRRGEGYAHRNSNSLFGIGRRGQHYSGRIARRCLCLYRHRRSPCSTRLRAAYLPRRRLYLDPRLLGLGDRPATTGYPAPGSKRLNLALLDPRLVGVGRAPSFSMRATGDRTSGSTAASPTAMANRPRLRRRPLGQWALRLQPVGQQREHHGIVHNVYNTTVVNNN